MKARSMGYTFNILNAFGEVQPEAIVSGDM